MLRNSEGEIKFTTVTCPRSAFPDLSLLIRNTPTPLKSSHRGRCGWIENTNFRCASRLRIESDERPGVPPNIFRYCCESVQLINSYHVLPACSDKHERRKKIGSISAQNVTSSTALAISRCYSVRELFNGQRKKM